MIVTVALVNYLYGVMYTEEAWNVIKGWRNTCHKLDRYVRNIAFLNECVQNGIIPKGFRMESNITYLNDELHAICRGINDNASNLIINEVIDWLDVEIKRLMQSEKDLELDLRRCMSNEDYESILLTVTNERQRINRNENDKQQRKLDNLLNVAPNLPLEDSVELLQPPRPRRRSVFKRGRNRRVNRNSNRRRKSNWIRPEARPLLNLLQEANEMELPDDMFDPIQLTEDNLDENEKNVCKLGLKFVPTVKSYDRVKKWLDIQSFKRKVRLRYTFAIGDSDDRREPSLRDDDEPDETHCTAEPWRKKSNKDVPPTDNKALEKFLSEIEKDLLDPKKECKVKDNLSQDERKALYSLSKMNKDRSCNKVVRIQDKGSRIVVEDKEKYIDRMFAYLGDETVFRKDGEDQSHVYKSKVDDWAERWKDHLTQEERDWIVRDEVRPGMVYGNVKTHKKDNPYRFIVSANGTAIENLARWIEYHLKDLSSKHQAYLRDTKDFLKYIEHKNEVEGPFEKEKLWMVSRDIVNYYPSCSTAQCIVAVEKLLDTRERNIPDKECILEALRITMNSNNCQFLNQHFTQIDGATIGGPESASVTDIYGAVFIDKVIEDNIINNQEDWKRYRDDSWSVSTNTSLDRESDKTEWMNENVVKGKIRFTMEASQTEMIFLDTKVSPVTAGEGKVLLSTDMYSKKTDTHQYLNPKSCHPRSQIDGIPIGVADRIRRNCSDNVENDENFMKRLVEYKAYLLKSGHDTNKIDRAFIKRASMKRSELLQKEKRLNSFKNKTLFVTEFEPSFPNVHSVWRKHEHLLKNDDTLRKVFPNGTKDFNVAFKRGGKNIKEWVAGSAVNTIDRAEDVTYECNSCPNNCVDCNYLRGKGQYFTSTSLNRRFKMRQNVNCLSQNVVYLVTCKKCKMQAVGETSDFKKRMANYRSCIRNGRISCNVDKHFVESLDHSLEDFDVQIICMLRNPPKKKKELSVRLKQFEGYWQIKLCTLKPYGMNTINELEANLKWSDKNIFYPNQDH